MKLTSDSLLPALELALQKAVSEAIEAAVDEAAEKVRARIREKMGPIACSLFSHYLVERRGNELFIKVSIGEPS